MKAPESRLWGVETGKIGLQQKTNDQTCDWNRHRLPSRPTGQKLPAEWNCGPQTNLIVDTTYEAAIAQFEQAVKEVVTQAVSRTDRLPQHQWKWSYEVVKTKRPAGSGSTATVEGRMANFRSTVKCFLRARGTRQRGDYWRVELPSVPKEVWADRLAKERRRQDLVAGRSAQRSEIRTSDNS